MSTQWSGLTLLVTRNPTNKLLFLTTLQGKVTVLQRYIEKEKGKGNIEMKGSVSILSVYLTGGKLKVQIDCNSNTE